MLAWAIRFSAWTLVLVFITFASKNFLENMNESYNFEHTLRTISNTLNNVNK